MATPTSIPSRTWEDRKAEILRLYVDESYPLKLVMKTLRTDAFDPTESQYRTKLKKWKRRKPRNTRLRRRRSPAATIETLSSRPHGDELSSSPTLAASSASVQDLLTTTYTDEDLTFPYPAESDPQMPQPYRLDQPQADLPQPPSFHWPSDFDTPITSDNQWPHILDDKHTSTDEDSQGLHASSAWRRASQAGPSQRRVLRQTRLRENSSRSERQGLPIRGGDCSKISSNSSPFQDRLPFAHQEYDPTTLIPDQEHHIESHPRSIVGGPIREQESGYQPLMRGHSQDQAGHDPTAGPTFGGPQAAAYLGPGPYGSWPWGGPS